LESIGIRADATIALDIEAFEACLDASACSSERAIGLYGGDLVESLGHDCFAAERERLADRYEDALVTVAERRLAGGDLRGAIEAAQHVIARDPLREEAHAILIAVHGLVGSRAQIVRQYRRLQVVLERELGEPPLPETDATYRLAMRHAVQRSMERAARIEPDRRPALVAVSH
jgi:DNA-binding SARP family transcriptional activator